MNEIYARVSSGASYSNSSSRAQPCGVRCATPGFHIISTFQPTVMTGRGALLLLLWLVSCVNGQTTGYEFVRPTPVNQIPSKILTTDPSNPLKFNKNMNPNDLTTMFEIEPSADDPVKPTPVLAGSQTTAIAIPLMGGKVPVSNQLTTTPIAVEPNVNFLSKPTPVVSPSKQYQTDAANPNIRDVSVLPKMTTQIAEPDSLKPTAVTDAAPALETWPITVAAVSDQAPGVAPSTGSLIEPSRASNIYPGSLLPDVGTPNLQPQEHNKVYPNELADRTGQDVAPCVCSSYQEINPTPIWDPVAHVAGNGFQPQLFIPEPSKYKNIRRIPNVYQQYFIAQLNFFINNLPNVVAANVPAYY